MTKFDYQSQLQILLAKLLGYLKTFQTEHIKTVRLKVGRNDAGWFRKREISDVAISPCEIRLHRDCRMRRVGRQMRLISDES